MFKEGKDHVKLDKEQTQVLLTSRAAYLTYIVCSSFTKLKDLSQRNLAIVHAWRFYIDGGNEVELGKSTLPEPLKKKIGPIIE